MRILALIMTLSITAALAGCTAPLGESFGEEYKGANSNVDNIHVWQDGWTTDTTLCQTSIVLKGGESYVCTFTLNSDDWIVIDLDVDNESDTVDLITMDDLNYQKYQDGEEYYHLEDWTDFWTWGGQYGKNVEFPQGDWVVLVVNDAI